MPTRIPARPYPRSSAGVLGVRTIRRMFPPLHARVRAGELSLAEAQAIVLRWLRGIAYSTLPQWARGDVGLAEDMAHDLAIRLWTMGAARRFNPRRSTPAAFMRGVSSRLVLERFYRRQPPRPLGGEVLDHVTVDGDQLDASIRREQLQRVLNGLSDGEIRALVERYGPLGNYGCEVPEPKGRRRRIDATALPNAVEIIERLRNQLR